MDAGAAFTAFTCVGARSGSLVAGLALALAVEALVVHLWLAPRLPWLAWALTAGAVLTILWLAADYRALAGPAVRLSPDEMELRVGRRVAAQVPRSMVADARPLTWRDLPVPGGDYLNATAPAEPNVLVAFRGPVPVRAMGGVRRRVRRLGLRLDEPGRFLASLTESPT